MREYNDLKIAVAGTGYVGMSIATLIAQHHDVTAVDVVPEKVEKINQGISPIQDKPPCPSSDKIWCRPQFYCRNDSRP